MTIKEFYEKYGDVELTEEQEKYIKDYLKIKYKRWKPKIGVKYFYIDSFGDIEQRVFGNDSADKYKILMNNMFRTKEEAKLHLEKLNVYHELKLFADENNEEIDLYNINVFKSIITFNIDRQRLDVIPMSCLLDIGQIYFSSKELAEQAIEKVGADRIKKYLFEVE